MLAMLIVMLFPLLGLPLFWWLPLRVSLPVYVAGLAASALLHLAMRKASRLPVQTGAEGMIGRHAVVLAWAGGEGWVRCGVERWHAIGRTGEPEHVGDGVRVGASPA